MIQKEPNHAVKGYHAVSDTVILIRLKIHSVNIKLILVYAPTADANEEKQCEFYGALTDALGSLPQEKLP